MEDAEAFWIGAVGGGKVDPRALLRADHRPLRRRRRAGRTGSACSRRGWRGSRLDGRLVADAWSDWKPGRTFFEEGCDEVVGTAELEAGRAHEVVIEFADRAGAEPGICGAGGSASAGRSGPEDDRRRGPRRRARRRWRWSSSGGAASGTPRAAICSISRCRGGRTSWSRRWRRPTRDTVVVLQTGGPVEMPWLGEVAGGACRPGIRVRRRATPSPTCIFGVAEPGGRLPQSFPVRWARQSDREPRTRRSIRGGTARCATPRGSSSAIATMIAPASRRCSRSGTGWATAGFELRRLRRRMRATSRRPAGSSCGRACERGRARGIDGAAGLCAPAGGGRRGPAGARAQGLRQGAAAARRHPGRGARAWRADFAEYDLGSGAVAGGGGAATGSTPASRRPISWADGGPAGGGVVA